MHEAFIEMLQQRIQTTHSWLIETTESLTEAQLAWIPSSTAPPIRWHLWHTARAADLCQASFSRPASTASSSQQIWHMQSLAHVWHLEPKQLGWEEIGAQMNDHMAATLALPEKQILLTYVQAVFQRFEQAIAKPRSEWLAPVIDCMGFELSHASRHLGMIEALRGVQLLHGTATT